MKNITRSEKDEKFCPGCGLPDSGVHYAGCAHVTEDCFRVMSAEQVREMIREELHKMGYGQ